MSPVSTEFTTCTICNNTDGNRLVNASEKMFATGNPFNYLECANCKTLSLTDPPKDPATYYPKDYYSFQPEQAPAGLKGKLQNVAMKALVNYRCSGGNILGLVLSKLTGKFNWIRKFDLSTRTPVLDVGCGHGRLLRLLLASGFTDLTGADPFIEQDVVVSENLRIRKATIGEVEGKFGFIMLNHTFEHLANPLAELQQLRKLITPAGMLLLRIPVADCHAWRTYGADWVQLDAPRHYFLHTQKGISLLAEKSGFVLDQVIYDSTSFQFEGSEKYLQGLPLAAEDPKMNTARLSAFKRKAKALNKSGDGDTASFYLRPR